MSLDRRDLEQARAGDSGAWQQVAQLLRSLGLTTSTIDDHKHLILQRLGTESWFETLQLKVQPLVAARRDSTRKKVKIAILDRSIDPSEILDREMLLQASWRQVKVTRSWVNDTKGNTARFIGSGSAALLVKIAPEAEIYVAHVVSGFVMTEGAIRNIQDVSTRILVEEAKGLAD